MTEIHPEFFFDTMKWECRRGAHGWIKAKSLAELQIKLGEGYTIKDYFPAGFNGRIEWPKNISSPKFIKLSTGRKRTRTQKTKQQISSDVVEQMNKRGLTKIEMMQDLSRQGFTKTEIGERFGVSKNSVIGALYRAKKKCQMET